MSVLLKAEHITKTYGEGETATQVLKGVSFELQKGEMIALLGPSGSGKSTLLTIIGTLMKPSSGTMTMLEQNLLDMNEKELTQFRGQHIGFVFQFHHLLPDFSARENVLFPAASALGVETSEQRARAEQLLKRVGLEQRINFLATQLSGGQKQRAAIARALMNKPEMVLADEPTGNLDRESAAQVLDLLAEINREEKTTFLISTHDERVAERCSRRLLVLDGQLVEG